MKKLIVWPIARAEAETVPLSNPITRAGQHQAPMSAGMLRANAKKEIMRPFRLASVDAAVTLMGPSGSSRSCSLKLFCALLVGHDDEPLGHSPAGASGRGSVRGRGR